MRGAVPCLSADLTTHAVKTLYPVGFENGEACAPRRAKRCGDKRGKRRRCARVLGLPLSLLGRRDESNVRYLRRFDSSSAFRRFRARANAAAPGKTKRIVETAAHIAGTTDVSTPAGVALYATAASRLRAPKLEALPAFHVKCSSLTPAGVVCGSLRRAAAG